MNHHSPTVEVAYLSFFGGHRTLGARQVVALVYSSAAPPPLSQNFLIARGRPHRIARHRVVLQRFGGLLRHGQQGGSDDFFGGERAGVVIAG